MLRGGERQRGGDAEDLRQHVAQLVEHLVGDCLAMQRGQTDRKEGLESDMGLRFMQLDKKGKGGKRKNECVGNPSVKTPLGLDVSL